MEPIEVTARFDRDGGITPLDFTWQGRKYPVTDVGRRWTDEEGEHILVMAGGERVYELVFASGRWSLDPLGRERGIA